MRALCNILLCLMAIISASLVPGHAADTLTVVIGAPDDVLVDYHAFMAGRHPKDIVDYSGPSSRRDVVEMVLFQQALILGGLTAPVEFKAAPTYRRLGEELLSGSITGAGTSFWLTDLEKDSSKYFITEPVIRNGEFEAGLYTAPDNTKAMHADTLEKVRELTAASNRYWTPDWLTLTALGLRGLQHIQNWKTMVRMVAYQRADFLLAPFQQTDGMRLHVDHMILDPIPGIKVGLQGSRHFAISKNAPQSNEVFDALQLGLSKLRTQGKITQAYQQCGFFNAKAKDWLQIYQPEALQGP